MAVGTQDLQFKVVASVVGAQAVEGLSNSLKGLNSTAKDINKGFSNLGKAAGVLVGALSANEFIQFGKGLIDTADNLRNVSQATGMSVETLDALKSAAAQADVPFDSLTTSLSRFSKNMVEAKNGNHEVANAFRNLGVSITDANGKLRPSGDVLKSIADRFSNLKDGPEKAALAIKLFGKSGAELIPLLNEGSKSLSEFGAGFTTDFANRSDQFNDTLARIGDQFKGKGIDGLKVLLPTLQEIASALENMKSGESTVGIFEALGEVARVVAVALNSVSYVLTQVGDAFVTTLRTATITAKNFADQIITVFGATGRQLWASLKGDAVGGAKQANEELKDFVERERKALSERDKINDEYSKRSKQRAEAEKKFAQDVLKNSLFAAENANKSYEDIKKSRESATAPQKRKAPTDTANVDGLNGNEQRDKIKEFIQLQQLEIAQRRDAIDDLGRSREELAKLNDTRKLELESLRASKGLTMEQKEQLAEATAKIKEQRMALIDLEEAQRRSWGPGATQAFRDYRDAASDTASQVKGMFSQAFQNMEDSLVTFVKTGKADFKKFADDIITDLIRIQVRALIVNSILSLGSLFSPGSAGPEVKTFAGNPQVASPNIALAKGGVVGPDGPVSLKRYANGGVATYPQMALFGEGSRPEAYVPLPDGRTIPVTMTGKGGSSNVVNVSVNVEGGQSSVESQSESGKQLGTLIAAAVQQELIKQQRPGGLLAS